MRETVAQLLDGLRVLRKHWAWIAACAATAAAGTAAWTWTRPPLYEASALISIEPDATVLDDPGAAGAGSVIETHRYLIRGTPVMKKVAKQAELDDHSGLARSISVDHVPDTRILRIRARANTPELARDLANATAEIYSAEEAGRRVRDSKHLLSWLQEQMVDLKAQVEESELTLIQYVETAQLDLVEVSGGGEDKGLELSGSPVLRDVQIKLSKAELDLDRARLTYTNAHPKVVGLRDEIKILKTKIGGERKRIAQENKKRIRYEMLKRDAELNREMFAVFMKEMKRVNLVGDDPMQRIRVEEHAVAPSAKNPIAPRKAHNMLLGLLAGLLVGVGLSFLQESMDRSLKRPDEIERAVGLPVLATVHRKPLAKGEERFLVQPDGTWGRELEDFRTLRTNLRFAKADGENRVLLVTSALPQEGKTTIVTNLAMVMGQAGERVLILDADLRRPAVHSALGMDNERGLSNLLAESDDDPLSAVRQTPYPNVFVVTAGAHAPNPPELLESARLKDAVTKWSEEFDRVLIDTPPVGSVVDPCILAPIVDGVALLVSTGRADADRVRAARAQLENVGAKFFGVIVNRLATERHGYYGYGYGYYGYDAYYSNRNEKEDATDEDRSRASG